MSKILLQGIDADTGQQLLLDPNVDVIYLGTMDFGASFYTSGDISIGTSTDNSYDDVDATNAQITFNVNLPGKYIIRCNFSYSVQGDTGLSLSSQTSFRLTDGTNNSLPIAVGGSMPSLLGFNNSIVVPIFLSGIFNFATTGSKTVKLQKKNTASTNVNTRSVLAGADSSLMLGVLRVSD